LDALKKQVPKVIGQKAALSSSCHHALKKCQFPQRNLDPIWQMVPWTQTSQP